MSIQQTSLTGSSSQSASGSDRARMMKDDFLKLLVAQLRHQDPLNPMEAMEFTSQLSQLAQLEQMYTVNDNLNSLRITETAFNNMQAANLIGKEISARGNQVTLQGNDPARIHYQLGGNASSVIIRITNQSGQVVRTIENRAQQEGVQTVEWDGKDGQGNHLPDGIYRFAVTAVDREGNPVDAEPMIYGRVTGLSYRDTGPVLTIGALEVPLGNLYEIREAQSGNQEATQAAGSQA